MPLKIFPISIYLVLWVLFLSCSNKENDKTDLAPRNETIHHPTPINVIDEKDITFTISNSTTVDSPYKNFSEFLKIGDDETDLLGEVESVVIDKKGNVIVLDSDLKEIRIYSAKGDLANAYTLKGEGPGEFRSPEGMVLDRDGFLYVIDRYNRVNKYDYANQAIEYEDAIMVDYVPIDLCVLNEYLVVRGIRQPRNRNEKPTTVHLYSRTTGEHVRSFGNPYKSDNWLVVNQLSDGPVGCLETSNAILTMFEHMPYIYAYSEMGELMWTAKLDDFKSMDITEGFEEDGRPYVSFGGEGISEVAVNIVSISNDRFIVQTNAGNRKTRQQWHNSYTISGSQKQAMYLGKEYSLISYINDEVMVVSNSLPYPHIRVLKTGQ